MKLNFYEGFIEAPIAGKVFMCIITVGAAIFLYYVALKPFWDILYIGGGYVYENYSYIYVSLDKILFFLIVIAFMTFVGIILAGVLFKNILPGLLTSKHLIFKLCYILIGLLWAFLPCYLLKMTDSDQVTPKEMSNIFIVGVASVPFSFLSMYVARKINDKSDKLPYSSRYNDEM